VPCLIITVSLDVGTEPLSQKRGSLHLPVPPSQVTVAAPTTCGRRREHNMVVVGCMFYRASGLSIFIVVVLSSPSMRF